MAELRIDVYGRPAPQGSKRHVGRGVMIESSRHVKPWRQCVQAAAMEAINYRGGIYPLDGPLTVSMVFTTARPKGHYRTGRNAHLLRDAAPARPAVTPDLSKLLRSTEDALTDAGVWRDDALIVEYTRAAKVYVGADPDALFVPGARITIRQVKLVARIRTLDGYELAQQLACMSLRERTDKQVTDAFGLMAALVNGSDGQGRFYADPALMRLLFWWQDVPSDEVRRWRDQLTDWGEITVEPLGLDCYSGDPIDIATIVDRGRFRRFSSRDYIPASVRRAVYLRDGYRCLRCRIPERLSLDHIIPWSKGGPDTVENLQTLCRPCNSSKGASLMARIRTIKPEFWGSPDTAQASFAARLLYIAMWNWADDFGIGIANMKGLAGFAFENDDQITGAELPRLCKEVADCFGTQFYTVRGRSYYSIPSWDEHQKTERRAKRRNPGPDDPEASTDLRIHGDLGNSATTQGSTSKSPENPPIGTGEQGNIGTGEQGNRGTENPPASPAMLDGFDESPSSSKRIEPGSDDDPDWIRFWDTYPLKKSKDGARKSWRSAVKRAPAAVIVAGAERYRDDPGRKPEFTKHPTTWLNQGCWDDELVSPRSSVTPPVARNFSDWNADE